MTALQPVNKNASAKFCLSMSAVYMEPKTCINYFQEENYAVNINEL